MPATRVADASRAAEPLQVALNVIALRSPLTGVGHYTLQLAGALQTLLASPPWLFDGVHWRHGLAQVNAAAESAQSNDLSTDGSCSASDAAHGVRAARLASSSNDGNAAPPGLTSTPPAMPTSAIQSPSAALRAVRQIVRATPGARTVANMLMQQRFTAGTRRHGITLYHEPNFLAFRYRGPTVVTVHDLSWIRFAQTHPADRVRRMNRAMPTVVRQAAHIVVDSDFIRREVIDYYGVAPARISTVALGVTDAFAPRAPHQCAALLSRLGLAYGSYLLAVGTLEPRKNLATVLAAFARLPAAQRARNPLVIAGGMGWRMDGFSHALSAMLASGEVRLTGYVAQDDLPLLYAGARMLLYPSLYEGFGLPPLEAMASGVPVIVSDRASLPEVVGDAALQVDALDAIALAEQITRLLEDDRLHARLREAGLIRARQFSWDTCARRTLAIYRAVLAQ